MGPQATWYVRQLCRLLGAPTETEAARLMTIMVERHVEAHEPIFSAGDRGDTVFIVVNGRIKLSTAAENGKEVIVDLLKAGDILGETALVENGVRQLSAEALEESTLLAIRREDFEGLMRQWPALAMAVTKILAQRLLSQQILLQRLVSKSVSSRLALLLLDELSKQGSETTLRLDLTHQEIAQLIGTSRETVTALLSRFQGLGIIKHERRTITIYDMDMLNACAQGHIQVSPRHPLPEQRLVLERIAVGA